MPVIPGGLPGFTIRPPCTLHDATGEPSDDLYADAKRVFDFIDDERHLTAHRLWGSVQQRLHEAEQRIQQQQQQQPQSSLNRKMGGIGAIFSQSQNHRKKKERATVHFENLDHDIQKIKSFLEQKKNIIDKLENCSRIFLRAQRDLVDTQDWTFASKHFGVTTHYRREADGSLSIKLEGDVEASDLFEQICVLREVDLHYRWSPLCNSSLKIADIDKLDGVGWFVLGLPSIPLARDGCFRAIGCDNILEDGSIIIAGQGIQDIMPGASPHEDPYLSSDPIIQNLNIPPIPNRSGCGRMTIRQFKAVIKINSPTSVTTKLITNINPNVSLLPDWILEIVMKHAAGMVLAKLQNAAWKAAQNPVTNVHAQRMREESEFYMNWLLLKFKGVCEARGWEMPRIAAFELSHHERHRVQQQQRMKRFRTSKAETFHAGGIADSQHLPDTIEVDGSESEVVVANLSQVSNDSNRMRAETESLSALSTESGKGSIWLKTNPVAVLRERDLKKKQQKEKAIADGRRKAEERIVPRELSLPEQHRLEELKRSKERRRGNEMAIPEEPEAVAIRLPPPAPPRQGLVQAVLVVFYLVLFFMMLHIDRLAIRISKGFHMVKYHHIETLESVTVVAYIFFVAILFYMIGVFVLHCAFESLEISRKTGRKTKIFYDTIVKKLMGLLSFGIVAASLLKGLLKVTAQRFLDFMSASTLTLISNTASRTLLLLPEDVRYWIDVGFQAITLLFSPAISVLLYIIQNGVFLFLYPLQLLSAIYKRMTSGLDEAAVMAFGRSEFPDGFSMAISWSREAFDTASTMFQYTLSFICTLFVLHEVYRNWQGSGSDGVKVEAGNGFYVPSGPHSYASTVQTEQRFSNGDYLSSEHVQPVTPDTSPSSVEEKTSSVSVSNNSAIMLRLRFRRKVSSTHSMSMSQDEGPRIPVDESQSKACSY